ncbi:aquaporin [bacterium]|nr:aquaporin [bacterium]
MPGNWLKAAVAEAIGVFALVFVGVLAISAGSIVGATEGPALVLVAFAHGLTIAVMVAATAAISGGHINPAVTFCFVVTGRMKVAMGAVYWIAQLAGGVIAAFILVALFGKVPVAGGTPDLHPLLSAPAGMVLEIVATFFLVYVIFATAVDERAPKYIFPLAIGLTVVLDIMAIGPLTGGAMNPARVFGPALASGHWDNHWLYWAGPLIGGMLAAWLQHFFMLPKAGGKAGET